MRKLPFAALLIAAALLLVACGGGSSSSSSSGGSTDGGSTGGGSTTGGSTTSAESAEAPQPKTPETIWAKEVEGVMREFENTSSHSIEAIHVSTSQYNLEPVYARYSQELAALGKQLEATKAPAECRQARARMGELARKVSNILGVLGDQSELNIEEFFALAYQQKYKFARVGRQLTNQTIHVHC